jgi:2-methylisocitrate lyase-like PEP mutase family enzyme
VLPNVWDAASAEIVAEAGYPAVATASAAISAMLGYPDGEGAPWREMFAAAGRFARVVSVPVTVSDERDIATLVAEVPGPINGNTRPGGPDLARLRELGVARVSFGPRLYREALTNLKAAVQELLA